MTPPFCPSQSNKITIKYPYTTKSVWNIVCFMENLLSRKMNNVSSRSHKSHLREASKLCAIYEYDSVIEAIIKAAGISDNFTFKFVGKLLETDGKKLPKRKELWQKETSL